MSEYDLYAIGNALVDIEYHTDAGSLGQLGIEKGVMTLIDEQRQNSLIAQLGESHEKMACGGSAANTVIALAQLGGKGHYDCRVSSDVTGQFFARDLHDSGVNSNLELKPLPAGVTGKCLVFVTPDADRSMNTFLGACTDLDVRDVDREAIADAAMVYIEGYLAGTARTRDVAIEVRRAAERSGIPTSMTLSDPTMVRYFRDDIDAMLGDGIDLLFANEEEVLELTGAENLHGAMEELKAVARRFAVTRGPKGALLYDGEKTIDIEAHAVDVVDTLGAGDMFAGAFLYGIGKGMDFSRAGELASLASAKIVTRFGPRLEAAQTQALLRQFNAGK